MNQLILWDIDGTLIQGGGVAAAAMRRAMERVYGNATTQERLSYAGKTDQQILFETFPERTTETVSAALDTFTAAYLAELNEQQAAFRERAAILPGVVAALERLQAHGGVIQSLLTGNLLPIARFKLDALGLSQFFDFDSGAFGSDHHARTELVPIAAARAATRYGRAFTAGGVVVIGDTPNDIACGRVAAARTIAVATGPFGVDELLSHHPDVAFANLTDTDAVVAAILGSFEF